MKPFVTFPVFPKKILPLPDDKISSLIGPMPLSKAVEIFWKLKKISFEINFSVYGLITYEGGKTQDIQETSVFFFNTEDPKKSEGDSENPPKEDEDGNENDEENEEENNGDENTYSFIKLEPRKRVCAHDNTNMPVAWGYKNDASHPVNPVYMSGPYFDPDTENLDFKDRDFFFTLRLSVEIENMFHFDSLKEKPLLHRNVKEHTLHLLDSPFTLYSYAYDNSVSDVSIACDVIFDCEFYK